MFNIIDNIFYYIYIYNKNKKEDIIYDKKKSN